MWLSKILGRDLEPTTLNSPLSIVHLGVRGYPPFFSGGGADASLDLENSGVKCCIGNLHYRALSPGDSGDNWRLLLEALTSLIPCAHEGAGLLMAVCPEVCLGQ